MNRELFFSKEKTLLILLHNLNNAKGKGPHTKVISYPLSLKNLFNPDESIESPNLLEEIINIFFILRPLLKKNNEIN